MPTSPPPEAQQPTVDGFLRSVLRSKLLTRDELKDSLRAVPKSQRDDPHALADHLVYTGKLSRFQASKLLKGIAVGLVLGPYQLLAPIGKGGMGTVFLARDGRSDQLVALKILPPHKARQEERMLVRFRREMELSRKVQHAHVAWTYEVGEYKGAHYLAMEYIPGRTLSRLVIEDGPLAYPRAARLLSEVAQGLDHAHGQGLIHRDLKPSNIQITPHDHAKILDLGLALIHGETGLDPAIIGGQGYIVGTMDYIAPEQTTDATKVDARSDLYALGCTLYFTLTGRPPFPGGSSKDKVHRHRHQEPTPLEELRPDLPPGFVEVVRRLMCKAPAGRPPSARAVADELHAWAEGDPPPDLPPVAFDITEAAAQGPGSSEYSMIGLPDLESLPEVEEVPPDIGAETAWPAWMVIGLAGLCGILLLVLLGLFLALTTGRWP